MHRRTLSQSKFRNTSQNTALPKHSRLEAHLGLDSKHGVRQFAQFESAPGMQQTSNHIVLDTPACSRAGTEWPREINLRVLGTNSPLRKTHFCPEAVPSFHSTDAGGYLSLLLWRYRMCGGTLPSAREVLRDSSLMLDLWESTLHL